MAVRAKFKVHKAASGSIEMYPVVGGAGNAENDAFFKATPGGSIQFSILNDAAAKQFEVGAEYYVDFARADTK